MVIMMGVMLVLALIAGPKLMGMHGGHEKPQQTEETVEKKAVESNPHPDEGDQPSEQEGDRHENEAISH